MSNLILSIVVPVYNEEKVIDEFYGRANDVIKQLGRSCEMIFVNDGSRDATLAILKRIAAGDKGVKIISFSRNFGHQIAISAGIDYAQGDAVIVIDADLQDPPELIPSMLKKWEEGYDVVFGMREKRLGERIFKILTAKIFYRLIAFVTNVDIPSDVGDFRLMSRKAVVAFKKIKERHRFVRGLVSWLGFKQTSISYVRDKRYAGKTKYSLPRMMGFSLEGITSFSIVPLRVATYLGFACAAVSLLYMVRVLYITLFLHTTVKGWPSLMVVVLMLGGVQLISIGILGEYVGRIFDETKQRPLYLIDEEVNT